MRFETRVYSTLFLIKVRQVGYLASLGQARTAEVKRDAIIGKTVFNTKSFFVVLFVLLAFLFVFCVSSTHSNTGEAEAKKDSTIAEAKADEQRMEAKLSNDTEIARWEFCFLKTNCQLVQSNFHQGQAGL